MPKCVLAFSGSLETLLAIPWLKEHRGLDVVSFSANMGEEADLEELGERALLAGAVAARIEDLRDAFFKDFISGALRALAHYETHYLLSTALSRPLLARELVRVALEEGATHVAHGCSGRGNDQVRLEAAIQALGPHLKIVAPQREWELKTQEQKMQYVRSKRLTPGSDPQVHGTYKYDRNLWGQSIKCPTLEDPGKPMAEEAYKLTKSPMSAPDEPETVEIEFRAGLPIALNGKRMPSVALIEKLNEMAGHHGIGRADLIEDRLVGFKSHEIYEAPAAVTLYAAKRGLEQMTLSRETLQVREGLSTAYGRSVYNGQWFSDLREALDQFYERINQSVTGKVTVRLYKGTAVVVARCSEFSLYQAPPAGTTKDGELDSDAAQGFIRVWSMPLTAEARRKKA
ncbi:MAG: argininosuccinate synthase [Planctomycetota bacterium]|nr:argininosuccinate synthase [Planctomycetota bacterium]